MKTKIYILAYESKDFDNKKLSEFLDKEQSIMYWFYNMERSFFIVSKLSAEALSTLLEDRFGDFRHFIGPITSSYWGRLPKEHWPIIEKYLNND